MVQKEVNRLSVAMVRLSLVKGSSFQSSVDIQLEEDVVSMLFRVEQIQAILNRISDGRSSLDEVSQMRLINESRALCEKVDKVTHSALSLI